MVLRPRVSLDREGVGLSSLLFSGIAASPPSYLLIRAPLTLHDDDDEEEEEYSYSDSDSASDSEPSFPGIKLFPRYGASSSSESSKTSSERTSGEDPVREAPKIDVGSTKGWIFQPSAASPGGSIGDQEVAFLEFKHGPRPAGVGLVPIARVSTEFEEDEGEVRVVEEIEEDGLVARVPGAVRGSMSVASASDGEMSEIDGVAHRITGGKDDSSVRVRPSSDDDSNGLELLEVSAGEESSMKDASGSYISDDEIGCEEVTYGVKGVEETSSPEIISGAENISAFDGVSIAENLLSKDAVEISMEEASFESVDAMGVQSSGWKSELTPVENEFSPVHDSEPETLVDNSAGLNSILEEASTTWASSLVADVEKIALYDPSSDRDEGAGEEKPDFSLENEKNILDERCTLEKIELLRVKFSNVLNTLGCSREDSAAARDLGRLTLALGGNCDPLLGLEGLKSFDLDFCLNIIVLGKSGVGKSSTINSLLGEQRAFIDPLAHATADIEEFLGTVNGIKVRVLDTPGLGVSPMEQAQNRRILSAVKKYSNRFPPDIVLYVDRLDTPTRDFNDRLVLQTITRFLGPSIWERAILTLTHAAGYEDNSPTSSYEAFVGQRLDVIRCCIDRSTGLNRTPPLVSLVENSRRQEVPLYGEIWRLQLLLLCYSMKITAEANSSSRWWHSLFPRELIGIKGNIYVPRNGMVLDGRLGPLTSLIIHEVEDENLYRGDINASIAGDGRSSSAFSLMELGGESAIRADFHSQLSAGRNFPKLDVLVGLKDKLRWKVTLQVSCSDGLQVSVLGLLPIAVSIFQSLFRGHGSKA